MNVALWSIQGLLAALFLFGGISKLAMPLDELVAMSGLPGPLILFIGICETLGAFGLILPWALRILPGLTPLAAIGLAIITLGATVLTAAGVGGGTPAMALFPFIPCLLSAFVAYGRLRTAPRSQEMHLETLQTA